MRARSFSHVGITVSDFNRTVRFWWEIFGCPLVGVSEAPPGRVRGFFGNDVEGATCRIGWIRLPGGAVIEIFHFEPKLPAAAVPWHRIGQTHICVNVRNVHKWHAHLADKGVEIVCPPEQSPRGHWLFFIKDFDGNLIEITDLRRMYYVLRWLGPLGGWIFRRGRYKRYYQDHVGNENA
jgi:catechol 2,3-dioxygenase-like lactoylglutathione lyase family enzyme